MTDILESILPSGRGIRVERIRTGAFRAANKRAAQLGATTGMAFGNDINHELLLASLVGTTMAPLAIIFRKDEQGAETTSIDLDATLEAVSPQAWTPHNYQALITSGPTALDEVLADPADYQAAVGLVGQAVMGSGPLAKAIGNRHRVIGQ